MKMFKIELIDDRIKKPFLGGYRDLRKRTEYHNAAVLTNFFPNSHVMQDLRIERTTQTAWSEKCKLLDTAVTVSTQTPVKGLYLLEKQHVYVTPRGFSDMKDITEQVVTIQKWWRRWLTRKKVLTYLERVRQRAEAWEEEVKKIQEEKEELRSKLELPIDSIISDEEFEHAYGVIELERKRLVQTAKANYSGQLLTLAHLYIILQEIGILNKLEHRKRILMEGKKLRKRHKLLNQLSRPRTWVGKNGKVLSLETKLEQEFNKWKEIYNNLTMDRLNTEQRKEVLHLTYEMLELHENEDVQHIKEIIIKELNLLDAGVKVKNQEALHKIIEHHLFDHLETYALKLRPKEMRLSQLKNRIYTCCKCRKVKPEDCFHAHSKTKKLAKCKSCVKLENISDKRIDFTVYRFLLRALRKEEARLRCISPTVFIMQVEDIYHLINSIWHARSALSNKAVLEDLRLCRFDHSIDWSPWNCFLITHEEMLTHHLVTNPYEAYGQCLVKLVDSKHKIAREHFKFLFNISYKHAQTESWLNIKKSKPEKYYEIKHPKLSYICQPSSRIKLFSSQSKKSKDELVLRK